ncbi:MAG: tyrosine-type recombinase/integrase [Jaaginema sp. PMC 1079.18]|nr:tyrosine-type recombinase/integrase [Jaaginema sp. PMC 1080.18]MEC4850791.1 tyrosine-type recombinase/integrase [Jaaginema sp. PMC 1079.18]MEC4866368.1 tyrosine-type recombinase/integrase [Jaaginema sp. PMC 1078.18]
MLKHPKGSVVVCAVRGRLRLQLPREVYRGKQVYFSLALADTSANRAIARERAAQIERDILLREFDSTLAKYKRPTYDPPQHHDLGEIFEAYYQHKLPQIAKSSKRNYTTVTKRIADAPSRRLADAPKIKNWLLENHSPDAVRRTLEKISAACTWAIEQGMITANPFEGMKPPKQPKRSINPFTAAERDAIIEAFALNETAKHYTNFVKFLFYTGCRPSEAIALQRQHISPAMTDVVFSESVTEGHRKTTKTGTTRKFPVNDQLTELLDEQLKSCEEKSSPIFPSKKGDSIDLSHFSSRYWQKVVKPLDFKYRGIYHCRHTFITLALEAGVPIQQIAYWVGNSPDVILKFYAGLTRSEVPEL